MSMAPQTRRDLRAMYSARKEHSIGIMTRREQLCMSMVSTLARDRDELRAHRDQLLQRNNITLQEKRDAEAALAEARRDSERLDWLDAKWWPYDQTYEEKINPDDDILLEVRRDRRKLRETIDAARREGK